VIVIGGSAVVSDVVIGKINEVLGYSGTVRWAGPNRYATAATMSVNSFGWAAETAFVANGFNFPDALAGGPSGGAYGGPMLLTTPASLPSPTAAELVRRDPARIFVLGGATQVSETVVTQIEALFP
jgi:putative cell wall-binding protein